MNAAAASSRAGATPTSSPTVLHSESSRSRMPSDYAAISADHRRRWGEDGPTDLGKIAAKLYPDRTHFVVELLQNAQDAGATRIRFDLTPDGLRVLHDGRLFTEADVRG